MTLETELDTYFKQHPCAAVKVSSGRKIVSANRAAFKILAKRDIIGQPCFRVLFEGKKKCVTCALDKVKETPYYTYTTPAINVARDQTMDEWYITCFAYKDDCGRTGCYKTIHKLPAAFERHRTVVEVGSKIRNAETADEAIQCIADYFTNQSRFNPYRVRRYEVDDPKNPNRATCCWHDTDIEPDRPYIKNLLGTVLTRSGPEDTVSFYSLNEFCIVLVTPWEEDVNFFMENYQPSQEAPNIWVARSDIFKGLRLYRVTDKDRVVSLFESDKRHCWLDIPFGVPGHVVGKISITPQGSYARFTREEMEEISSLISLANAQIANVEARMIERREMLLGTIHEVAQPAFMALTSIEFLRRKDRENNVTPETDALQFYVKKNIEMAIRMVAFLNDAPRVRRDVPSFSPIPTNLIAGAMAPIVNMLRHEEFSRELNRRRIKIEPKHLVDLDIPVRSYQSGRHQVKFQFDVPYEIYYDDRVGTVNIYVEQYRLQEVFYNLFGNACKYRQEGQPLKIEVSLREDNEFEESIHALYSRYYVLDVDDYGLGIDQEERRRIFGAGERGSAAKTMLGYSGTGKGLFVAREIMLSIGGEIYVAQCENPTRFRLFFPALCNRMDWIQKIENIRQAREELRNQLFGYIPDK